VPLTSGNYLNSQQRKLPCVFSKLVLFFFV